MNVSRLLTRPVQVSTPTAGTVDEYGNAAPGTPTTVTVNGYVEQTSSQERTDGQQTVAGQWWAALPIGTAVVPTSKLYVPDSGQTFEVTGAPATKWNPVLRRNEFVRVELSTDTV